MGAMLESDQTDWNNPHRYNHNRAPTGIEQVIGTRHLSLKKSHWIAINKNSL